MGGAKHKHGHPCFDKMGACPPISTSRPLSRLAAAAASGSGARPSVARRRAGMSTSACRCVRVCTTQPSFPERGADPPAQLKPASFAQPPPRLFFLRGADSSVFLCPCVASRNGWGKGTPLRLRTSKLGRFHDVSQHGRS
jgi:hypothetical protein